MKFAAEMPLEWMLKHHDEFNDYLYVLLHLYLKNDRYREFCKNYQGMVILDNSCYELGESMDNQLLFDAAIDLEPDFVILPDKLNFFVATCERSEAFVNSYRDKLPAKTQMMGIIQGKNDQELIDAYNWMYKHLNIRAFGIPFIFGDVSLDSQAQMIRRLEFMRVFDRIVFRSDCYHHLLGTWCTAEFALYPTLGYNWINSFDTSNPIMAALEANRYRALGIPMKPRTKLDEVFYHSYETLEPHLELARYNVNKLRQIIQ